MRTPSSAPSVGGLRQSTIDALALPDLKEGERVADIGCGPGPHLALLADDVGPGGAVFGVDVDQDVLIRAAAAERNAQLVEAARVQLLLGSMDALPFEDGELDAIWSSHMLHHVPDQQRALQECARVLRAGGRIAVLEADLFATFPFIPWPPRLELALRAAALRHAEGDTPRSDRDPQFPFSARYLPRLVRAAGFHDVRLHAVSDIDQAPFDERAVRETLTWLRTYFSGRVTPHLSDEDRHAFEDIVHGDDGSGLLASPDAFVVRTWFVVTGVWA